MTRNLPPSDRQDRSGLSRRRVVRAAPLGLAAAALGGVGLAALSSLTGRDGAVQAASGRTQLDELSKGGPWLNSPPLGAQALRGKVVLVNFWTYTCINSLRPLPYLRSWAEKYANAGLVVVGAHSPEFSFERSQARVQDAVLIQDVRFPVVMDNDLRIWRGFGNGAWPGFHFVDARGRVRRQILGEGQYETCERVIQALLGEARGAPVRQAFSAPSGVGAQAAPAWDDLGSPETYLGHGRATGFVSPGGVRRDKVASYRPAPGLGLNRWSLAGRWRVASEAASLAEGGGAVTFRFHARDLHMVMAPAADGRPLPFQVRIDGRAPGGDHGVDTDAAGRGKVEGARMYQLVRQAGPVRDRTFEISFPAPGVSAYAFTFG
jgi:thiol-disulfide isomerase/thioredoxin